MKKVKKIILLLCALVSLLGIMAYFSLFTNTGSGLIAAFEDKVKGDPPVPIKNEIVMEPNATIEAKTDTGTIIIRSGKGLKRYYTWDGITRSVVMLPRSKRWYGSLGIYYPGLGSHWLPKHKGISRGVLEEGEQYFETIKEAMDWLHKHSQWCPTVYRDDGLVVAFGKTMEREQLNVDVWQIYIEGKKPTKLEGSKNDAIKTSWDQ